MTNEHKKALLVFGGGFLLFWLLKPKMNRPKPTELNVSEKEQNPKDREIVKEPTINKSDMDKNPLAKNGFAALKAYVKAYNNKEPQSVLDELNREFAKEFKVRIYRRKSDNKLVASDLEGNDIIVNHQ
jgi:hypothetical protein